MSCYILCPNPAPLILQISYILKYLDFSDLILADSQITKNSFSIPYTHKPFFSNLKFPKKKYYDTYYDIKKKYCVILKSS